MARSCGRRTFLKLVAASGATASLWAWPGCKRRRVGPEASVPRFLAPDERAALEAVAEAILPEDQSVGARGANAVEYIDRFLAAFEASPPALFRGGPFSGRAPWPDPETGEPTNRHPPNDFLGHLPPTRTQELAFRILLYGSDSVPNGNINAPLVPSSPGLRAVYRQGVARLREVAAARDGGELASLDPEARLAAFDETPRAFQEALLTHLAEGMFCAPEYGGNRDGVVWRDHHYDGDSQPLGHTLFDSQTQTPRDRPDQPNQSLDPRRPNDGLEPGVEQTIEALVTAAGGRRFF